MSTRIGEFGAQARGRSDAALGFAWSLSVAATLWACRSMPAMGEIPMPGGWSMSAAWMPMCGQSRIGAAAAFAGMWTVMMTAMMLPSSAPLWRQCGLDASRHGIPAWLALPAGAVYGAAWALAGVLVFCAGNALATWLPHSSDIARSVPLSSGAAIAVAGAVQFTAWKRRCVTCRSVASFDVPDSACAIRVGCRFGLRLALHEGCCCANLMAAVLAIGVMDWRTMAAATAAATAERLAPLHGRTARGIGAVLLATGVFMIVRVAASALA